MVKSTYHTKNNQILLKKFSITQNTLPVKYFVLYYFLLTLINLSQGGWYG